MLFKMNVFVDGEFSRSDVIKALASGRMPFSADLLMALPGWTSRG
jgi:hypothetical protein